jgi:hypothetical protein
MRRSGITEHETMKIGGWKTASIFRRYDIVDENDLQDAAAKIRQFREKIDFGESSTKVSTPNGSNEFQTRRC